MKSKIKISRIILFISIFSLFLIYGCDDGLVIFESNSSGQCIIQCKAKMEQYHCISSVPSYHEINHNGITKNQSCECTVLNCITIAGA